jgi:glucosyl-3-phosphoglycerate synthase
MLSDVEHIDVWLGLAASFADERGQIKLVGLVTIPEAMSLSEGVLPAQQMRSALAGAARITPDVEDTAVIVDYQPLRAALDITQTDRADLLIVQWQGPTELTGGLNTDEILGQASCDVALIAANWQPTDGPVMLSLRGGPNLSLGLRTAKALACSAPITLFHAADQRRHAPELEFLMRLEPQITRTVTAVSEIANGILQEAHGHSAVVLGATFRQPEAAQSSAGPVVQRVFEQTSLPLILVRARQPEALSIHLPHPWQARTEPLSTRVDRWFAHNTFHSHEFADIAHLLELKQKQGVTISVGLPALNEAGTIGDIIRILQKTFMEEVPLVDELVLIDSASTDETVAIAQLLGVPAHVHQETLTELGSYVGKGEALWKSLYLLRGDIITWVDTDITNFHPRFVYGLLGPLLKNPQLQYVKGFYQRPIKVGEKLQASGGGRVTELVARPLLNLFYPELSGLVQPLSGEYAGRRTALEQIPFFTGYGVETGMLIDLVERFGLDAIAQADLEMRVHRNQPLEGLSKMSFAILQVLVARLESHYGVQLLDRANRSMKTIIYEPERFALEINAISDIERPPMISVPAYQQRHLQPEAGD